MEHHFLVVRGEPDGVSCIGELSFLSCIEMLISFAGDDVVEIPSLLFLGGALSSSESVCKLPLSYNFQ